MNTTIQDTLLDLFHQVIADPDRIPAVPIDAWPGDSEQQHLLTGFRDMLGRMRQSKQQAEEQLREREAQYRAIFEASTDALFIQTLEDGCVVEANPAACKMHGYTYEEMLGLYPTAFIHPDSLSLVAETLRTLQAGGQYHTRGMALRKDGIPFHAEARVTIFTYRGQPHILSVVRDITEQIQSEEQLREREEQYRSIFEATTDALFINNPNGAIVEVNPAACKMLGYPYEELIGLSPAALVPPDSLPLVAEGIQTVMAGGRSGRPLVVLHKDGTPFPVEHFSTQFTYKGKPHYLSIAHDITERVEAQQLLEQRVEERTSELSTLLEISHHVTSTLELKSLLGLILEHIKVVADYDGATVTMVEGEHLVIIDYRGTERESMLGWRFPLKQLGLLWETLHRQEVVIVEDVSSETPLALAYRQAFGDLQRTTFASTRAWMAIPMILKERVVGVLNLSSREPHSFTARHAPLALGIANQAAIAIENARLYEQVQELAALEERQKLARELHDSVSQALYGISLGAHAARTALSRDPQQVAEPLDYVLSLAEAGLAEMRALIFELRPESLEAEGLVSALTKQAAALQARHEILVSTEVCNEPDLSLRIKQELYRIVQEAMHNIVKHAHANKIDLRLEQAAEGITLEVRDNGTGFDTTASFPGHLGLHSMRERVANLGGTFEIESAKGAGTRVCVCIPGRA